MGNILSLIESAIGKRLTITADQVMKSVSHALLQSWPAPSELSKAFQGQNKHAVHSPNDLLTQLATNLKTLKQSSRLNMLFQTTGTRAPEPMIICYFGMTDLFLFQLKTSQEVLINEVNKTTKCNRIQETCNSSKHNSLCTATDEQSSKANVISRHRDTDFGAAAIGNSRKANFSPHCTDPCPHEQTHGPHQTTDTLTTTYSTGLKELSTSALQQVAHVLDSRRSCYSDRPDNRGFSLDKIARAGKPLISVPRHHSVTTKLLFKQGCPGKYTLKIQPRHGVTTAHMKASLELSQARLYVEKKMKKATLESNLKSKGDRRNTLQSDFYTNPSVSLDDLTSLQRLRFNRQLAGEIFSVETEGPQQFREESTRFASFHGLDLPLGVWIIRLAAAGFYLFDRANQVARCAYCDALLNFNDDNARSPMAPAAHVQSPLCPVVTGQAGNVCVERRGRVMGFSFIRSMFGGAGENDAGNNECGKEHVKCNSQEGTLGAGKVSSSEGRSSGVFSHLSQLPQSVPPSQVTHGQQRDSLGSPSVIATPLPSPAPAPQMATQPPQSVGTGSQRSPPTANNPRQSARSTGTQAPVQGPALTRPPAPSHLRVPAGPNDQRQTPVSHPRPAGPVGSQTAQPPVLPFQTAQPALPRQQEVTPAEGGNPSGSNSNTDEVSPPATAPQSSPSAGETQVLTYTQLGIYTQPPKRQDLVMLHARIGTFTGWPHSRTHDPEEMARAGFYYVGQSDLVRCFHCKGGLKSWAEHLRPWMEHARFFPHCQFVGQVKGQEFVDVVQELKSQQDTISAAEVDDLLTRRQQDNEQLSGDGDQEQEDDEASHRMDADKSLDENHLCAAADELETENQEMKNGRMCKICQTDEVSILFVPCGHLCSCAQCASALRTCAICRQQVKGRIRVVHNRPPH